jgi:hypothetical protein
MTTQSVLVTVVMALAPAIPALAQSPADLLQKGIYAQETSGDLDSAISIFRQVANSANKTIAAQAQYQLVLCMLQKGDRAAADAELETLARNFPDQADLVTKARKLLPGGAAILPAPWGDGETSQLNIKRDGVATGDYLTYSIEHPNGPPSEAQLNANRQTLRWELTTKKSRRSVEFTVDRTTGQAVNAPYTGAGPAVQPILFSDDTMGDPAAEPLAGPAIDIQQSVFSLRRLPLAVGYKTTLTTLPFTLATLVPKEVELAVTAIEPIEVTAGKFRCYKVSLGSLGQTLWIGMEGSRPLVKIKAGNVEAELVKIWGPEDFIDTELAFFTEAGWRRDPGFFPTGPESTANFRQNTGAGGSIGVQVKARKLYTPAADIPAALRAEIAALPNPCDPETIEMRVIGEQQALSCYQTGMTADNKLIHQAAYTIWIKSTNATIELSHQNSYNGGADRWRIDRTLATAKRIP